ncbi:hypothetical protein Y600_5814 [Burkholderia pseudomallei MSHR3709]|nr:hypothetical protein Y600_5814 [Burkholderia pseudomallei MSHR3709]
MEVVQRSRLNTGKAGRAKWTVSSDVSTGGYDATRFRRLLPSGQRLGRPEGEGTPMHRRHAGAHTRAFSLLTTKTGGGT